MASDNEASCESDPNFAIICAFIEKFGVACGITDIDFHELQEMLEDSQKVSPELIDLHIKLLRKTRKTVHAEHWERALVKLCHTYSSQDAWEIERFGYKKARLTAKVRVLKELLEMQFDYNVKFKAEINKLSAEELRMQPLGRDRMGHAYWYQCDENCQMRIYKEDPDEETWVLVAKDRDGLVSLISGLTSGDSSQGQSDPIVNEDSNSLAEKPILDTGQPSESNSSEDTYKKTETSDTSNDAESNDTKISTKEESEQEVEKTSPRPNLRIKPITELVTENEKQAKTSLKRAMEENDNAVDVKRPRLSKNFVTEAIEDPVLAVQGEGSGSENECGNFQIFGDVIEEPLMLIYGAGSGRDCEMGNEEPQKADGNKKEKSDVENSIKLSVPGKNSVPFKLGTIMDSKKDNRTRTLRSPTKKSRWDVGKPVEEKSPSENCSEVKTSSKPLFFFGPGCFKFNTGIKSDFEPVNKENQVIKNNVDSDEVAQDLEVKNVESKPKFGESPQESSSKAVENREDFHKHEEPKQEASGMASMEVKLVRPCSSNDSGKSEEPTSSNSKDKQVRENKSAPLKEITDINVETPKLAADTKIAYGKDVEENEKSSCSIEDKVEKLEVIPVKSSVKDTAGLSSVGSKDLQESSTKRKVNISEVGALENNIEDELPERKIIATDNKNIPLIQNEPKVIVQEKQNKTDELNRDILENCGEVLSEKETRENVCLFLEKNITEIEKSGVEDGDLMEELDICGEVAEDEDKLQECDNAEKLPQEIKLVVPEVGQIRMDICSAEISSEKPGRRDFVSKEVRLQKTNKFENSSEKKQQIVKPQILVEVKTPKLNSSPIEPEKESQMEDQPVVPTLTTKESESDTNISEVILSPKLVTMEPSKFDSQGKVSVVVPIETPKFSTIAKLAAEKPTEKLKSMSEKPTSKIVLSELPESVTVGDLVMEGLTKEVEKDVEKNTSSDGIPKDYSKSAPIEKLVPERPTEEIQKLQPKEVLNEIPKPETAEKVLPEISETVDSQKSVATEQTRKESMEETKKLESISTIEVCVAEKMEKPKFIEQKYEAPNSVASEEAVSEHPEKVKKPEMMEQKSETSKPVPKEQGPISLSELNVQKKPYEAAKSVTSDKVVLERTKKSEGPKMEEQKNETPKSVISEELVSEPAKVVKPKLEEQESEAVKSAAPEELVSKPAEDVVQPKVKEYKNETPKSVPEEPVKKVEEPPSSSTLYVQRKLFEPSKSLSSEEVVSEPNKKVEKPRLKEQKNETFTSEVVLEPAKEVVKPKSEQQKSEAPKSTASEEVAPELAKEVVKEQETESSKSVSKEPVEEPVSLSKLDAQKKPFEISAMSEKILLEPSKKVEEQKSDVLKSVSVEPVKKIGEQVSQLETQKKPCEAANSEEPAKKVENSKFKKWKSEASKYVSEEAVERVQEPMYLSKLNVQKGSVKAGKSFGPEELVSEPAKKVKNPILEDQEKEAPKSVSEEADENVEEPFSLSKLNTQGKPDHVTKPVSRDVVSESGKEAESPKLIEQKNEDPETVSEEPIKEVEEPISLSKSNSQEKPDELTKSANSEEISEPAKKAENTQLKEHKSEAPESALEEPIESVEEPISSSKPRDATKSEEAVSEPTLMEEKSEASESVSEESVKKIEEPISLSKLDTQRKPRDATKSEEVVSEPSKRPRLMEEESEAPKSVSEESVKEIEEPISLSKLDTQRKPRDATKSEEVVSEPSKRPRLMEEESEAPKSVSEESVKEIEEPISLSKLDTQRKQLDATKSISSEEIVSEPSKKPKLMGEKSESPKSESEELVDNVEEPVSLLKLSPQKTSCEATKSVTAEEEVVETPATNADSKEVEKSQSKIANSIGKTGNVPQIEKPVTATEKNLLEQVDPESEETPEKVNKQFQLPKQLINEEVGKKDDSEMEESEKPELKVSNAVDLTKVSKTAKIQNKVNQKSESDDNNQTEIIDLVEENKNMELSESGNNDVGDVEQKIPENKSDASSLINIRKDLRETNDEKEKVQEVRPMLKVRNIMELKEVRTEEKKSALKVNPLGRNLPGISITPITRSTKLNSNMEAKKKIVEPPVPSVTRSAIPPITRSAIPPITRSAIPPITRSARNISNVLVKKKIVEQKPEEEPSKKIMKTEDKKVDEDKKIEAIKEEEQVEVPERRITRALRNRTAEVVINPVSHKRPTPKVQNTQNSKEVKKLPPSKKPERISMVKPNPAVPVKIPVEEPERISMVKPNPAVPVRKPVEEPLCVQKKVPLLTCDSVSNLTDSTIEVINLTDEKSVNSPASIISIPESDVSEVPEKDPLASEDEKREKEKEEEEEEEKRPAPPISLTTFSLDFEDEMPASVITTRSLRKRGHENTSSKPELESSASKKQKLKGKRPADMKLRRSIEEQKMMVISSSDEDNGAQAFEAVEVTDDDDDEQAKSVPGKHKKKGKVVQKKKETEGGNDQKPRKKQQNRITMGLDLSLIADVPEQPGIRHSRRIAQIKIKEEAERNKIEELVVEEMKLKSKKKSKVQKKVDKDSKKEKKIRRPSIENETTSDNDSESMKDSEDMKKGKRKRKHRDPRKIFDEANPWRSSSDSSSSNEDEEEEEIVEEEEDEPVLFQSDHEFSPESDLEDSTEVQPLKRARTARKESDVEEVDDDYPCQKCGKTDHPEWILLCDGCDNGWHCSCLRPALLVIPEGDWYCPPCQHTKLITNLEQTLVNYDKQISKRNIEERRKERLAYVGISLNNVLPMKDTEHHQKQKLESAKSEEGSGSSSDSSSSSSSDSEDEPIYQLRERRQAHSYRFNDYDELINSAIQDEMEAVKGAGNQGKGKDISTIVNAEKEEEALRLKEAPVAEPEPLPPVVPKNDDVEKTFTPKDASSEDEEPVRPKKKIIGRRKPRKLNSLDISSGDDQDDDEDFKGSTSSEEEDEFDDEEASDSSESGRKNKGPVRRSTRARISRYDREFINDDSEDEAPRKKKIRSIWDDSESEESDRSWGRRKRKAGGKSNKKFSFPKKKRSKKKKKKGSYDSDPEVYKNKKKPKVRYGRLVSDEEEEVGIRTRGKKINYLDVLGTDSDEETVAKKPARAIESEEEYVVNEEELEQEDMEKISEEEMEDDEDEGNESVDETVPHPVVPKIKIKPVKSPEPEMTVPDVQTEASVQQPEAGEQQPAVTTPMVREEEEEPNPIEEINKNMEEMDDKEMEKFMEEEEYANKQLQLVALQIEKEKKRKEREAKKLEVLTQQSAVQKTPKKRGRKPKSATAAMFQPPPETAPVPQISDMFLSRESSENDELSEPPGVSLPLFGEMPPFAGSSPESTPKKRRGRGKGKKTLAAEQAKMAAEARSRGEPAAAVSVPELTVAAPPQPFSHSQPTPSVITRMLQSQPVGYPPMPPGGKYYPPPGEPHHDPYMQNPRVPNPYVHQGPPLPQGMPSYPPPNRIRGPPPPHNIPPHLYPPPGTMDPSPSGERNSPSLVAPPADSPLSGKGETPPPPQYVRPPGRFPPSANSPVSGTTTVPSMRHLQMMPAHMQPGGRPNSVYHHPPPPSYYGSYPPPPEEAVPPPAYQQPPYSEECDSEVLARSENSESSKTFEEEEGGEFGGLVSYFSSQREDDLEA